ncbi:MAG: NnrS family protein [Rubrivivax sp.]
MEPLLHIVEPSKAPPRRPSWAAFTSLGFRPLYAAGTAWAALAALVWIFAPQWLGGTLGTLAWHAHEMLWGFVATIAVGFLLTAGANWTGMNPLPGNALGAALVLWLMARLALLVGQGPVFVAGAVADVGFFALAAGAFGRAVVVTRNRRNAGVPLLLAALGGADALFLLAAGQGDVAAALGWVRTGLLVMATIALLIARRVIPFFAMRAVPGLEIPMHTKSGQWQLGAALLGVVAGVAGFAPLSAAGLAAAGAIALWQVLDWRPSAVTTRPILWILYLGHAGVGLGLVMAALRTLGVVQRPAVFVHVLAMLGFTVLIIGMVTRTALGHLGRALALDRSMVLSYQLVVAAGMLRLAALLPTAIAGWFLQLAAVCWAGAFALYLWRFVPWLVRPRADEPPGRPVVLKKS